MFGKILIGVGVVVVAYFILNALMARFSKVGRLAAKVRYTRDDETRKRLVEELAAMGRSRSMSGDAALVHLATLGLGDQKKETRDIAYEVLKHAEERALLPLIGSLDHPGRYLVCMLLEGLAHPAALPKLQQVATRPNEDPKVRHAALRAIQMIQATHEG